MTEEIIIDGVDVAGCEFLCTNQMGNNCLIHNRGFSMNCKNTSDCYYKQLQRLKQENKELSKLIRGTKDYAEVCSVCKDEVTIYPNISGRTNYTQNEVECRTLVQIITQKNNLEQENKELKEEKQTIKNYLGIESKTILERLEELDEWKHNDKLLLWKYHSALEEIREYVTKWQGLCFDEQTADELMQGIK